MSDEQKQKNDDVSTFAEELSVAGNQLIDRIQGLVKEGNVRRLKIRDQQGRVLLEVPLTIGVVGGASVALLAPFAAALGALAALVARVNIEVERYENPEDAEKEAGPTVVDYTPADEDKV